MLKTYKHKGSGVLKILQFKGERNNDAARFGGGRSGGDEAMGIRGHHLSRGQDWRLLVSHGAQGNAANGQGRTGRRVAQIRSLGLRVRAAASALYRKLFVWASSAAATDQFRLAVFGKGYQVRNKGLCAHCFTYAHKHEITFIKGLPLCLYCVEKRNAWLRKYCTPSPIDSAVEPCTASA